MTLPLLKSHRTTARKAPLTPPVESAHVCRPAFKAEFVSDLRTGRCFSVDQWIAKIGLRNVLVFYLTAWAGWISLVDSQLAIAQQPQYIQNQNQTPIRAYAPPVHIAPGSATALPPNRHRPKLTPGLQLVQTPDQLRSQKPKGLQDRLAQTFANPRIESQPTPAVARAHQYSETKEIGSGLVNTRQSVSPRITPRERSDKPQSSSTNSHYAGFGDSVVEPKIPIQTDVRLATVQDGPTYSPPVRHAYVQDYAEPAMEDQELLWVDDGSASSQGSSSRSSKPNWQPAQPKSVSVLRRQDENNPADFRPQPREVLQEPDPTVQDELNSLDEEFDRRKNAPENPRSLLELDNDSDGQDQANGTDKPKTSLLDRSCAEFRESLLQTTIRDIALDLSPPSINADRKFMAISRSWTDHNGQIVATGRMVDLRRGYVILENGEKIAFARLSESDRAAVSEHWNIPKSCLVAQSGAVYRNWQPQTFTWTAASLCHKPLYFENIQLERYGHSHGPFMQPVRSIGHFFVSLVTLPYQTAIHPPNECEYPLGLYRPGDCAPWLKDPIPISLDGMRRQALVTTGLAFIP